MCKYQSVVYSKLNTQLWNTSDLFVPILPIFRRAEYQAVSIADQLSSRETIAGEVREENPVVDGKDIGTLLQGHVSFLNRKFNDLDESFPPSTLLMNNLLSSAESRLIVVMQHIVDIVDMYRRTMQYMEDMLRSQIIAAVGRNVSAEDFDKYMQFHYRKLYRGEFAPRPWSVAVRRSPKHAPDGAVRIEINRSASDGGWQPIDTFCKSWSTPDEVPPMRFSINATTTITFQGSRHVHGYLGHTFQAPRSSATPILQLRLIAEARQFSSLMVVLGRISSNSTFDAKHAFIVENREEMIVPLHGETFPSAKEFNDAIVSLSPAQQRFAKAYRAMQLESTLFGVLLIQIKPPMERVLRLHPDSLTKEIKLAKDLLTLFLDHQMSSDFLCCEEEVIDAIGENVLPAKRIRTVEENVTRVQQMMEPQEEGEEVVKKKKAFHHHKNTDHSDEKSTFPVVSRSFPLPAASGAVTFGGASASTGVPFFGGTSASASAGVPIFGGTPTSVATSEVAVNALGCGVNASSHDASASHAIKFGGFGTNAHQGDSDVGRVWTCGDASLSLRGAPVTAFGAFKADAPIGEPSQSVSKSPQSKYQMSLSDSDFDAPDSSDNEAAIDLTKYPTLLDEAFDKLDPEQHAVRLAILRTGSTWQWSTGSSSLGFGFPSRSCANVDKTSQRRHRQRAFDLLDAMTRSGALTLKDCELHVVVAAVHAFDRSLMNTLVQANDNPIDEVERSSAILSSALHGVSPQDLLWPAHAERLLSRNPQLL